jgi:putative SOS response-associated peptidase YedK
MCGRYVAKVEAALEAEWHLVRHVPPFESYNVAPTQKVPVIRRGTVGNEIVLLRWGLIPFFAKGVAPAYSTINARIETVQTAASYRGPWRRGQRCAVLACGFYEWQVQPDGKTKQPYYIHLNDQPIFAFAGLCDSSEPDQGDAPDGRPPDGRPPDGRPPDRRPPDRRPIESCVHITMPANRLLSEIHNSKHRMPAILAVEDREAWLAGTPEEAWSVLKPYPDENMVAWPVSTRVNKPANNDEKLIAPV